jgi:hypothetical protein
MRTVTLKFLISLIVLIFVLSCSKLTIFNSDEDKRAREFNDNKFSEQNVYKEFASDFKAAMDFDNPNVIDIARKIIPKKYDLNKGKQNEIGQICTVYDYVYKNWKYVMNPLKSGYISPASRSINTMAGDCKNHSVFMCSILSAIGFRTRIVVTTTHAYPEVFLCNNCNLKFELEEINKHYTNIFYQLFSIHEVTSLTYHKSKNGDIWLNIDYTSQYPGGKLNTNENPKLFVYSDGTYEIQ